MKSNNEANIGGSGPGHGPGVAGFAGGNFGNNSGGTGNMMTKQTKAYNDYQDKMLSDQSKLLMEMFNRMLITMHNTFKIDTKFYPRTGMYEVVVIHQPDANFLFGLIKNEENKSKMMEIVPRLTNVPRNPISISDSFCFAVLDTKPCRAYVVSRDSRKARLFFFDWGNIDHVDLGKCYKIKEEAMKIRPLCMPFELRGCPCNTPPPDLTQPVTLKVEVRCINGPRRTILVNAFYNDKPYSDFFYNQDANRLVCTGMSDGGKMPLDGAAGAGNDFNEEFESMTIDSDFQLPVIEKGATVSIKIVSVITPSSFIFQTTDEHLQKAIKSSIGQLRTVLKTRGQNFNRSTFVGQTLKAGHTIIVSNEKILSRAHVLKVIHGIPSKANNNSSSAPTVAATAAADDLSKVMLEVILLETGEKCIITPDSVYPCPKELRAIPGLFYKGCLNNIKPSGGMSWDARATRLFASMVENVELKAKIIHVGRLANKSVSVHFMDLYPISTSQTSQDVSIADMLVNSKVSVAFRSN